MVKDEVRRQLYKLHATVCKAIADPTRLLIIEALRNGPRTVGELSGGLGLSQSNVSQHMAVLRQRALVQGRRDGNHVFYSLVNPKVLGAVDLLREVMTDGLADQERLRLSADPGAD